MGATAVATGSDPQDFPTPLFQFVVVSCHITSVS